MIHDEFTRSPSATSAARPTATDVLRRGACQLAALRAASAGIVFGPTLDDRVAMLERAREELLQIERAELSYAELTGDSLLAAAEPMLDQLPAPTSWLEASLARLLVCLSARVELERTPDAGQLAGSVLACEVEHVNAARAALHDLGETSNTTVDMSSGFAEKWLDVALTALHGEAARTRYLTVLEHDFGLARSALRAQ